MTPPRDKNPSPMIGVQHAASVATKRVIRNAIPDSEVLLAGFTARRVPLAMKYIHK